MPRKVRVRLEAAKFLRKAAVNGAQGAWGSEQWVPEGAFGCWVPTSSSTQLWTVLVLGLSWCETLPRPRLDGDTNRHDGSFAFHAVSGIIAHDSSAQSQAGCMDRQQQE